MELTAEVKALLDARSDLREFIFMATLTAERLPDSEAKNDLRCTLHDMAKVMEGVHAPILLVRQKNGPGPPRIFGNVSFCSGGADRESYQM